MPRIAKVSKEEARGEVQQIYANIEKTFGTIPNIFKQMAASPAVLNGYFAIQEVLNKTALNVKTREKIALISASENGCNYCRAAHSKGAKHLGIDDQSIQKALNAESDDAKEDAILKFCKAIVEKKGWVSDDDVENLKSAGLNDREIVEVIFTSMMNMFLNYFNHIVETEKDF